MKCRPLAIVLMVCTGMWAQSHSTQPSTGAKSARPQAEQTQATSANQLVGCLSEQGPNLVLMQPRQQRWYHLRGNQAQLKKNVGKMVKVTGKLVLGKTSAFQVQQVQVIQEKCQFESTTAALPAGGKTGQTGDAETVTSTASVEQTTPGVETKLGMAQDPAKGGTGASTASHATASQGAPQNPNVENPVEAQRIANAAQQAELTSQSQLGVNAKPNYSNANNPQTNAQAVSNTAQQERGQASGSDQVFKGGEKQAPASQAAVNGQSGTPVVTGCLSQEQNQFWLAQQGSGTRLRIDGDASKLKDHVNHTVQIVGTKTGTYGPAVGTSGDTEAFHVQAIQDVAPTCQQR